MQTAHQQRVRQELKSAGISGYALHKAEGRYLPQLIQDDEHIMAAAYGRTDIGSAMLIATDRRVLYLDKKPLMAVSDEISYEVVSGVGVSQEAGLFVAVTLHTRMGDYSIRYVNPSSARKFQRYIGKVRLEGSPRPDSRRTKPVATKQQMTTALIDARASAFIASHGIGVLSTMGRDGQLQGSVVYYVYDSGTSAIYMLTKSDTKKAHNILATHQVAFTVYDEAKRQTLQLQGVAEIEANQDTKNWVFQEISRPKQYQNGIDDPPVTTMQAGGYIVFRITPSTVRFSDYSKK